MHVLQIYAKLQSLRLRHQYGIFGGKSQTSFTRNAIRAGSEEGRLFSQAIKYLNITQKLVFARLCLAFAHFGEDEKKPFDLIYDLYTIKQFH